MQIEIKLDESCKEPNIIIHTDKMTEEVSQIVKLLSEEKPEQNGQKKKLVFR